VTVVALTKNSRARKPAVEPLKRGDHVELAQRFIVVLRVRGEFVFAAGETRLYEDPRGLWSPVSPEEQSRIVQSFAGVLRRSDDGRTSAMRVGRYDVFGALALAHDQIAEPDFFATAPPGIAFANGFVALDGDRLVLRKPAPENRARYAYPFGYTAGAEPDRLLRFLGDECYAGCDDAQERIECLREYVGSALLGVVTRYQRAVVLRGPGANGKSVVSAVLERAMPEGACVSIPPQQWGNEYRLAHLAGRRLNVVAELPEADIMASDTFKSVISGDPMTARQIREAPFTLRPRAGHLFAANALPGTVDQTHAFWRRFIVIEHPHVVPPERQDPRLADRLSEQTPAIVAWLLEGARAAAARGLITTPASSAALVAEWQRRADQVRAFLDECTGPLPAAADPLDGVKASALYRAYSNWANTTGHRRLSSTSFAIRLTQIGVAKRHTRAGWLYDLELTIGGAP
jgi:putative DNA primase/helicase